MSQWILKDTMHITASHAVWCLTDKENDNPTISWVWEKEAFMNRCESYHGNKLNLGNKTPITLVKDAEDNEENMGTFSPVTDDEEEDESQVPEQDDVTVMEGLLMD